MRDHNHSLKIKIQELEEMQEKFSNVENAKISLEKENEVLEKKNDWLTSFLSIFSCEQKSFEMILTSKKCIFDKKGLRFKSSKNKKYFKKYFVK